MNLHPIAALILVALGLGIAVAFTVITTNNSRESNPQLQRYHQKLSCEQQSQQFYQKCMKN